ncbi:MAG: FAD-dependent oxidoreductase [Terracidiphilus sp.]
MQACPVHTQAGRYVSLIAQGRYAEAYRYARIPNPFASICGHICGHPCESACRRGDFDAPISIRALKRFVTERFGPESSNPIDVFGGRPNVKLGEKVAIIGSGPAGMSAAHDLALLGYPVTIFEATTVPGGMMRLGAPEYRMPRDVLEAQIREILDLGPELKLNKALGRDFTFEDLRRHGYKAVLVACGMSRSRELSLPGNGLDGVVKGIDFLLNVNLGRELEIGKRVVVIGGGNVAIDVARSALRKQHARAASGMGALDVQLVCLESREEMPAYEEEIEEGLLEGMKLRPSLGPMKFLGKDGKLIGLEVVECVSVFDEDKRFNPKFSPGTEFVIPCDMVILAIQQASDLSFLKPGDGIETTRQGTIKIDPDNLMTTAPGIFAAGDIAFGPRLIINAVADGKMAAVQIDKFLRGPQWKPKEKFVEITVLDHHEMAAHYDEYSRLAVPALPIERRIGAAEVECGYTEEQARREASRCLRCWINTIFEGNEANGTECILCGGCVNVCPENCLSLVPLKSFAFTSEEKERLSKERELRGLDLQNISPAELDQIEGSVMVKDETICIRCGLCAERCPVNTISMEAFEIFDQDFSLPTHEEIFPNP